MTKIILSLGILLLSYNTLFSQQWHLAAGTEHVYTAAIAASWSTPETLYALGFRQINDHDSFPLCLRSLDGGLNWDSISTMGADLGALKVDPSDAKVLYASHPGWDQSGNDLSISTDGGITWRDQFHGRRFPSPIIEIDPVDRRTIYATVGPNALWISVDHGLNWQSVSDTISGNTTSMAIDPKNDSVLWTSGTVDVRKSIDKGTTFSLSLFHNRGWSQVAVNPRHPEVVYVALADTLGGVMKTTDGGITWQDANSDLPMVNRYAFRIVLNPRNPEEIFLGVGTPTLDRNPLLFRSTDGGIHWASFNTGLPDSLGHVESILFDTVYNRIFVGVGTVSGQKSGLYYCDYITSAASSPDQPIPHSITLSQNYPNPFNPSTSITFALPERTSIVLDVVDLLGRTVAVLANGLLESGQHRVEFNSVGLTSGVYFYRLHTPTGIITNKMMVVR